MRLNVLKPILLLYFILFSCTQEDKYKDYTLFIRNSSNQELNVKAFKNNIEVNSIFISSNERDLECTLIEVRRISYSLCDNLDSIEFIFPNGKGYLCSIGDDESLCFGNEITPWSLNEKFINTSNNIYEFTITQEDYENANDLP